VNIENLTYKLKSSEPITIELHSLDPDTQKFIYSTLLEILNFYNKEDLFTAIYTALFESTMNCVKANAKKAFFQEKDLKVYDEFDFRSGTKLFKKQVNDNNLPYYCSLAKKLGLTITINFIHSVKGLKVEILNNGHLFKEEENRIRTKLALGQKYVNIVEYHKDNSDKTEGEGLGLVVSILMLKEAGIPISDFRIGCKNGVTRTRIEVPFTSSYISERQKYKMEFDRQSF